MIGTAFPNALPLYREFTEREYFLEKTVSSGTVAKGESSEGTSEQTTTTTKVVKKTKRTVFVIYEHSGSVAYDEREEQSIQSFLENVYMLAEAGFVRHALDVVFQRMNSLLTNGGGGFAIADKILASVQIDRLPPTLLVGFLSITLASGKFLVERPRFYAKVCARLQAERGPEAAARLLTKYGR